MPNVECPSMVLEGFFCAGILIQIVDVTAVLCLGNVV